MTAAREELQRERQLVDATRARLAAEETKLEAVKTALKSAVTRHIPLEDLQF